MTTVEGAVAEAETVVHLQLVLNGQPIDVPAIDCYQRPTVTDGVWSAELEPNADIIPADTQWRYATQLGPGYTSVRFMTVPDSASPVDAETIAFGEYQVADPSGLATHIAENGEQGSHLPTGGTEGQVATVQADGSVQWGDQTGSEGGGAPTGATYLVATANGGLSAEVVVGATPGGELGGTWDAPTVDASHSGSTHAAVQAAAEATAAAALATEASTRAAADTALGTAKQDAHANLSALAGLSGLADRLAYFTGAGAMALATVTSAARSLLDDADAAAMRATLDLEPGTDVQAYDADLAAIAALVSAADRLPYATGSGAWSLATFTAFARSLLDDADAATARATLGVVDLTADDPTELDIADGVFTIMPTIQRNLRRSAVAAGDYFAPIPGPKTTTTFSTLNRETHVPVWLPAGTIDRIVIECTTQVATAIARLGIRADDGTGLPGTLIAEATTTADLFTATGMQVLTISATLPTEGRYHLVCCPQTAAGTIRCVTTHDPLAPVRLGTGTPTVSTSSLITTHVAGVSGALQSAVGTVAYGNTVNPMFWLRYSSVS